VQVPDGPNGVHGDDVRVLQICDRDGFLPESLDHSFAQQEAWRHDLDGDAPIEREVARAEHCGHPAAPQLPIDLELIC
jgi:hypothetical protein